DDTGQMSAWYIFGAIGFYPVTHGTGVYSVGSPVFPKMKIIRHTPEGKKSNAADQCQERIRSKHLYKENNVER
ncbi:MAG TPA: glycoside hydrolase domain-containing protein, partial [Flavisolibacter sp.]|nr:glycoside hydrolase domain-containing protein [Flavisolibacter sp.]